MIRLRTFYLVFLNVFLMRECLSVDIDRMEYNYAKDREMLQQQEREFAGNTFVLSEDEKIVDNYLEYLKRQEFEKTKHNFLPSLPIQDVLSDIRQSEVFRVLKRLPKGGNMHLHQNHVLDKHKILDIIFNDNDLLKDLCVDTREGPSKWALEFYLTPPTGWVKVNSELSLYSKENLIKHGTFINVLDEKAKSRPTDSETRWKELNPMFGMIGSNLVGYANYTRKHLRAMFQSALDENVQYIEARTSGGSLYTLDDSVPGGHRYLDDYSNYGDSWFQLLTEEIAEFKKSHPEFIGYNGIIQLKRYKGAGEVQNGMARSINSARKFPGVVRGVDLVAEEDQGYSLLYYLDEFMNYADPNNTMPFYFHTAETSWPDDLVFSSHPDDPVGTLENVYESIILGTKRIGHGIGFVNHPYLLQLLKTLGIAVEANPVSNMLIGYVTDQRHHPAINYIRSGVPVVLGADDPGTMGYNEFTVDWYEAFMAWGLRLKELKRLAFDSLQYSAMTSREIANAKSKLRTAWAIYVSEMKREACMKDLQSPQAEFHRVFPRQAPLKSNLSIRVYGRNFQSAICQNVICRFGTITTKGEYVYNTMLKCLVPMTGGTGNENFVDLEISFNGGRDYMATGQNFTFSDDTFHGQPSVIG